MRVTVCELPHEPVALAEAWDGLCEHTRRHRSELVLLPECAFAEPFWERERFDAAEWDAAVERSDVLLHRLNQLGADYVVGARPVTARGHRYNEGFLWFAAGGLTPLRRKFFLPNEAGGWEARWFEAGDPAFPPFQAGSLTFGLNICTELWALESYAGYATRGVEAILSPRATEAATTPKWLSVAIAGAVRAGAYSLSSNRVDPSGAFGGCGWIITPEGEVLATTASASPFATRDLDLTAVAAARGSYPRYVFSAH